MSERDSVHKEIEKLQEEIKEKNKKLQSQEGRTKHHDDEVSTTVLPTFLKLKIAIFFLQMPYYLIFQKRKWSCKIEMLKRELEQSMHERDKAMREAHELRYECTMLRKLSKCEVKA